MRRAVFAYSGEAYPDCGGDNVCEGGRAWDGTTWRQLDFGGGSELPQPTAGLAGALPELWRYESEAMKVSAQG